MTPGRCKCSHGRASHNGDCAYPGCGCTGYRLADPAAVSPAPRVVQGSVLRELAATVPATPPAPPRARPAGGGYATFEAAARRVEVLKQSGTWPGIRRHGNGTYTLTYDPQDGAS